jgi:hypothetical protein
MSANNKEREDAGTYNAALHLDSPQKAISKVEKL